MKLSDGSEAFIERKREFYQFPEKYRVEPFRIIGDLYFVGNRDVASYLIDTREGLLLIDTGYPTTSALLVYSIVKLGFRVEDIRIILHTHGHFDHIGATALIKEISCGRTYLGQRDAEMFKSNPELSLKSWSGCPFFMLFEPDQVIRDGDKVSLGETEILALETPGHSDGTVSYFFEVKEAGETYRCGLMGGAGLITLTEDFVAEYGRAHARKEYLDSLEKLEPQQVDINLGNHTDQNYTLEKRRKMLEDHTCRDNPRDNPFVDPGEWKRFIAERRECYWQMVRREEGCKFP